MSYSLATLWYERQRYLPGVFAVAFSALLIAVQSGLLQGLLSITSLPVDRTSADIWCGSPKVLSVDLGRAIPESYYTRLAGQPEVTRCEPYMQSFSNWQKPQSQGWELCMVIGSRLDHEALGLIDEIKKQPDLMARLTEPLTIAVDETEKERLEVSSIGEKVRINETELRVVGFVPNLKSLAAPYVFCSLQTARQIMRLTNDQTTYVLARATDPRAVVQRLNEVEAYKKEMLAYTSQDFSRQTRTHWLLKTRAGAALGCAAALGLLVGAVVTSQTLYAATIASLREYAVLVALGIPRYRIAMNVLSQAFWVGLCGICLGIPGAFLFREMAIVLKVPVQLDGFIVIGAAIVTMVMALLSGLTALRSLRQVEPATLLR